jgi:hypothetical protein
VGFLVSKMYLIEGRFTVLVTEATANNGSRGITAVGFDNKNMQLKYHYPTTADNLRSILMGVTAAKCINYFDCLTLPFHRINLIVLHGYTCNDRANLKLMLKIYHVDYYNKH